MSRVALIFLLFAGCDWVTDPAPIPGQGPYQGRQVDPVQHLPLHVSPYADVVQMRPITDSTGVAQIIYELHNRSVSQIFVNRGNADICLDDATTNVSIECTQYHLYLPQANTIILDPGESYWSWFTISAAGNYRVKARYTIGSGGAEKDSVSSRTIVVHR